MEDAIKNNVYKMKEEDDGERETLRQNKERNIQAGHLLCPNMNEPGPMNDPSAWCCCMVAALRVYQLPT